MGEQTILILAGDKPNLLLYKKLISLGKKVDIFGFDQLKIRGKKVLDPGRYTTIVTSIPFSIDGERIHSPYSENSIYIDDFIKRVRDDAQVIGGPFSFKDSRFIDITKDRDFVLRSVIPTCEEVLKIIISKWEGTIYKTSVHIIGKSSLTKRLRDILGALGAEIVKDVRDAEIIINCEVSQNILKNSIREIKNSSLVIDLSTKEESIHKRFIKARSLAVKSAPVYMAKTLYETLIERDIIRL